MITINNKQYRNLEEQVQYLTDFHEVNQALASWGIKIVGQITSADQLPLPYTGDYGDAYAVGTESPYNFYIWTRASATQGEAYWFNFGEISIVGPQGPQGPEGPKGNNGISSTWYAGNQNPQSNIMYKLGDMYLNAASGSVFRYNGESWQLLANIMGPQGVQGIRGQTGPQGEPGPQGPKGDTGDVGGFINIAGILENADQLPTPISLQNLTIAYLIEHTGGTDQANDHYDLYIQVGSTSAQATWNNVGPFNAATLVTVNGVGQNVWNADTKVDVTTFIEELNKKLDNPTIPTAGNALVSLAKNTGQPSIKYFEEAGMTRQYWIPQYLPPSYGQTMPGGDGRILALEPLTPYQVANKKYVDEQLSTAGGGTQFYKHKCKFNKIDTYSGYDFSVVEAILPVDTNFNRPQPLIDAAFGYGLQGMMTGYTGTYYSEQDSVKKAKEVFNLRQMYSQEHGQDLPFCSTQDQDGNFTNVAILYTAVGGMGDSFEYTVTPL